MPLWLQYLGFFISLFGFLLTIATFATSLNVRKQLLKKSEKDLFRIEKGDIISKIEGFISSINEDRIFVSDKNFHQTILQFLTDIETRFAFFSKSSQRKIKALQNTLRSSFLHEEDWMNIANNLIALKNFLNKELI